MIDCPTFDNCKTDNDCGDLINNFIHDNDNVNEFFYPQLLKNGAFRFSDDESINCFIEMERERLCNLEWNNSSYMLNKGININETNNEFNKREAFETEFWKIIQTKINLIIDYELKKINII